MKNSKRQKPGSQPGKQIYGLRNFLRGKSIVTPGVFILELYHNLLVEAGYTLRVRHVVVQVIKCVGLAQQRLDLVEADIDLDAGVHGAVWVENLLHLLE